LKKTSKHLTLSERSQIFALKANGFSYRQIAAQLGRNHSVISREIKHNSKLLIYDPEKAHQRSKKRKSCATSGYRTISPETLSLVNEKLALFWSPEQISGYLKTHGLGKISHETIYKMIWRDKKQGGNLYTYLRHRGKKYNKRSGKNAGRGLIPDRVDIQERETIVEEKSRIGDFEGDTVIGANHQGAIVTLVDRKSKFLLCKFVDSKSEKNVSSAILSLLKPYKNNVLTLTFDNGKEFAGHKKISKKLNAKSYFAKPYCSWQRGLNEHTNGLLRQFIPKKTDFKTISHKDLITFQNLLNNRPRKVLGYKTPAEVFYENSSGAFAC
jgi:IS30 family transposase